MKTCTTCQQTLPIDAFHRDSRTVDGRRNQCKTCRCSAVKEWYDSTKPEREKRRKESFKANPERRREWDRARYQRDREKRLALANEQAKVRRARLREAERDEGISRDSLRARDGDTCFYCGRTMSFAKGEHGRHHPDQATIEHLVRISAGGTHTWGNVVLSCWRDNIQRGRRSWDAWRDEVRGVAA